MINLDRHIEILLLSNDCVIVPGFGGFMAHHIDARKDESDGSFLPPIRSIGFNPKLTINDSLLAQSYVEAYDISYPDAVTRIEDEVRELRQRIAADGRYEFTDIGTITLNEDGNYEFMPCEAGIVSPKLYGLGSFKMKTISEIREAMRPSSESTSTLNGNKALDLGEGTTLSEYRRHSARTIALWRNIAVASIAIIFFLLIPSPIVNNPQIAGSHINTQLLDKVMPKDITTGQDMVSKAVGSKESRKVVAEKVVAEKVREEKKDEQENRAKEGYSIVLASHVTQKNAVAYANDLQRRGYKEAFVMRNGHVKVLYGHYTSREEASKVLNSMNDRDEFSGAWIMNVKY